jgi:hypothetical protein
LKLNLHLKNKKINKNKTDITKSQEKRQSKRTKNNVENNEVIEPERKIILKEKNNHGSNSKKEKETNRKENCSETSSLSKIKAKLSLKVVIPEVIENNNNIKKLENNNIKNNNNINNLKININNGNNTNSSNSSSIKNLNSAFDEVKYSFIFINIG